MGSPAVSLAQPSDDADAPSKGGDAKPPRDRGSVSVPKGQGGAVLTDPEEQPPAPTGKAVAPRPLNYVPPDYPPAARAEGLEATVTLQLDIDKQGSVVGSTVVDPAGHGFDEAAIAASKKLEFSPARRPDGRAAPSRILYRYSFTLDEEQVDDPSTPTPDGGDDGPAPPAALENFGGTVLASGGDAALAGATVTAVAADGTRYETTTDASGNFELNDLPPSTYQVSIRSPGFEPLTVAENITTSERTEVKYRLVPEGTGLEVTVRGERPPREVVKRTLERREIERIPGTNGDALKSIQNLPGVARPPGIIGVLLVRGSGPADTQTFIDGTPVPLIYHFGGLSSVVPTELLDKIDFYPGNFSTQYGRVMGGIVDAGLRSPKSDGYHGLVQVDLIDARALIEGPIPFTENWSFVAAGRRSYIDTWLGPVLEEAGAGVTQAPVYWDYQFYVEHETPKTGRFRTSFFGSDDRLELLVDEPAPQEPAFSGNVGLKTSFQRLQFQYENAIDEQSDFRGLFALGQDNLEFGLGPLFFLLGIKTATGRLEHSYRVGKGFTLNTGVDVFAGLSEVKARLPAPQRPGQPPNQPFSTRNLVEVAVEKDFFFPALYMEGELTPTPRSRIVPGVRMDFSSAIDEFAFSPRVNGRYNLVHGYPRTTAKAGVGMFHQPPQFQQMVEPLGNPELQSNRAIHYALGLEQELSRHIEASVEGFFKQLDSLVTATPNASGTGNDYDNQGKGTVIGSEVLLKYKPDDRFFGWLAYTLSRSGRIDRPGEEERLVAFDQTHILTVLGSYRLGHGWEFGARFRLVSGNLIRPNVCNPNDSACDNDRSNGLFHAASGAYTPIPLTENVDERLPLFHQLDIRVDKRWPFEDWQLSAYLDVQNVYNNQNAEAVQYNFDYTARSFINGLPILPSIGLRADF